MSDPDMGAWSYTYDALDLTAQTDACSCTTSLDYDTLDRLTSNCFSEACDATTDWVYDENGCVITEMHTITGGLGIFTTL